MKAGPALAELVWGTDPKKHHRLQQWSLTLVVYLTSAAVMSIGVRLGIIDAGLLQTWCLGVLVGLGVFFVLMRSGYSARWRDPALTDAQIVFGALTVVWGYSMCNEVRSATLFTLILTLTFGAFSLSWQRMAALTALSISLLAMTIAAMHHWLPGRHDLRVDLSNLLMIAIVLPAVSIVSVRLSSLRRRLRREHTQLERALLHIEKLATQDELTGLTNRRRMRELLQSELRRSERSGASVCVALLDLDHFKCINDRYGHAGGDEVLRLFARSASHAVRDTDVLCRWGGEEFLLLTPTTGLDQACRVLQRIRQGLGAQDLSLQSERVGVTFSAGLAQATLHEGADSLIERADRALYRAKGEGRNRDIIA